MEQNELVKIIKRFPNQFWSWDDLSRNPNLTIEIFQMFSHQLWNWDDISRNPSLTMEMMEMFIKSHKLVDLLIKRKTSKKTIFHKLELLIINM